MFNKKLKKILAGSSLAAATVTPPPLTPAPSTTTFTINGIIIRALNWIFWAVAFVALAGLLYGGFLYITAGGEADKTTKARNTILYALLGVFVIFGSAMLIGYVTSGNAWSFFRGTGGGVL